MTLTPSLRDSDQQPVLSVAMQWGGGVRAFGGSAPTSTAWPVANSAYAVPFTVSAPFTFTKLFFVSGTSPGTANFSLGVYRDDWTSIVLTGAVACVNTTDAVQPANGSTVTSTTLQRGRYYLAMSAAATTITVRASALGNSVARSLGMQSMATAHPLPATFTPASMGTVAFIPNLGMGASFATLI